MSSLRNFGIAFVVAILIFGLTAYFGIGYVEKLFSADNSSSIGDKADSQKFDANAGQKTKYAIKTGRSFNVVVIGTDYDPVTYNDYKSNVKDGKLHVTRKVEATAILFIRFDKENRALRISSIPAETAVTVDYVPMTLGQAYAYKGGDYIKDKVASYVGMAVDYLFVFTGREFAEFTQTKLLNHAYTVPVSVITTTEKGVSAMSFSQGSMISGELQIFTLLHHVNYGTERAGDRHKLLSDICLQTLTKLAVTDNASLFYRTFIAGLTTNMNQTDVQELIEVLYALPLYVNSSEAPTTVSIVDFTACGSYTSEGSFFVNEADAHNAFDFSKTE